MSQTIRRILMLILGAVFVISLFFLGQKLYTYWQNERLYSALSDSYVVTAAPSPGPTANSQTDARPTDSGAAESPVCDPGITVDFNALRQINSDICGWLYIPGTEISYPILQGEDNSVYLHTAFDGTANTLGSIFLDKDNAADFSDLHTVIYGHRARNKSMFGALSYYSDRDYALDHAFIYILTPEMVLEYQVFSVETAPIDSPVFSSRFETEDAYQAMLDTAAAGTDYDLGITPAAGQPSLTLSTCTASSSNTYRFVVHAVCTAAQSTGTAD